MLEHASALESQKKNNDTMANIYMVTSGGNAQSSTWSEWLVLKYYQSWRGIDCDLRGAQTFFLPPRPLLSYISIS